MDKYGNAARLLFGGAGLLLVFGACSDSSSPAVGSAVSNTTATAVVAATSTVGPSPAPATTIAPVVVGAPTLPLDGAALLQQAVAASSAGYHFNQSNTVDGVVALTVDGDRLPDGARVAVSNASGLVFYVITPDGTWLMPQNGEWELDDSDPPAVDPIASLSAPSSVSVASSDGTTAQLVVNVPLSSIGLEGDGDVPLQVSIVGGALTSIIYSTTTADGQAAVATTAIGAVVDPSPVVPPI